jgi:hypothetical protein
MTAYRDRGLAPSEQGSHRATKPPGQRAASKPPPSAIWPPHHIEIAKDSRSFSRIAEYSQPTVPKTVPIPATPPPAGRRLLPQMPSGNRQVAVPDDVVPPPGVSRFRVTNDCVPSEWAVQRYVDRRLATCTVADPAKIGDSPWERCTCVRGRTIPASEPPVRLKPCVCRRIRRRRAAAPRGR